MGEIDEEMVSEALEEGTEVLLPGTHTFAGLRVFRRHANPLHPVLREH